MRRRAFCLALLGSFLAGCSLTIPMRYQPSSAARPLDLEVKPRIYLEQVEDRTGGGQVAGLGARGGFVPSISESLREALEVEFARLGIPLVAGRSKADAVLSAAVTMAGTRGTPAGMAADLGLVLSVKGLRGETLWENTLLGSGVSQGYSLSPWGPAFTAALADLMSKVGPAFQSQDIASKILAAPSAPAGAAVGRKTRAEPPVVRSDIDELPRVGAAKRPNAYAVVIGVRQYRQELPQADFADSDARLMRRYLTEALGFEDSNVAVLINEEATKSDLEKYLESWLPNRVEKEADVVVYYSGHGAPDPASGQAFLVPYDGDPTYLAKTGYPLARLYAELGKLPAKNVTIVMDACFSGAGGRSVLAKGAKPLVNEIRQENVPKNLAVLAASAGNQISHAYHEKGHGLFTYFLLKVLKEGAGKSVPGWKSAFDAAAPQVARIARREYNADQEPQWQGTRP